MRQIAVVRSIFIAPAAKRPMVEVPWVFAESDSGLRGPYFPDRYFLGVGTWSDRDPAKVRHATLISWDALQRANEQHGANFSPIDTRRNLLVEGLEDLLFLIDRKFRVGEVEMLGYKDCAPCSLPSKLSGKPEPSFEMVMAGRGGLRVRIVSSGKIVPGDDIFLIED